MVNWMDPGVLSTTANIYDQVSILCLGFLGAHYVVSFSEVEWQLLRRRRHVSWSLIPYMLGRYCMLTILLFFTISKRAPHPIACDAAYRSVAMMGSLASCCSSLNLSIRTCLIWRDIERKVVCLLRVLSFIHFCAVIMQGIFSVSAVWDPNTTMCVVTMSSRPSMVTFYLYTTLLDLVILVLTVYGLLKQSALKSVIGSKISVQVIGYCATTLLVNIPTVVFATMDLSPVMNTMFSQPAATVSVVASSYAFTALRADESEDPAPRPKGVTFELKTMTQRPDHVALSTNFVVDSSMHNDIGPISFDKDATETTLSTSSKATASLGAV